MGSSIMNRITLMAAGLWNPVLLKEMRTGTRKRFPFIFLTFFLTVAACAVYFLLTSALETVSPQEGIQMASPSALRAIYRTLFLLEMGLLIFTAPLISGGAVSGEREQRTFSLLLVTRLPVRDIISGKLAYVLFCLLLPVIAIVPVNGFFWLIGVLGGWEMIGGLLLLAGSSGLVAILGIYFSTRHEHTITAMFYTYGVLGALTALFFLVPDFFRGGESIPIFGARFPASVLLGLDFLLLGAYLFFASVSRLRAGETGANRKILFILYIINVLAISGLAANRLVLMPELEILPGAGRFWLSLTLVNLVLAGIFGAEWTSVRKKRPAGRLFPALPLLLAGAALLPGAVFLHAGFSWEKILPCVLAQFLYPAVFLGAAHRLSLWRKQRVDFLLTYFLLFLGVSFVPYFFLAGGSALHRLAVLSPLLSTLSLWEGGLYMTSFIIYFVLWLVLSLLPTAGKGEN